MAAAMLLGKGDGLGSADSQNRVYVGSVPYTFTADDIKVRKIKHFRYRCI